MGQQAEKDRKSNRTKQKNKKGDNKVELNDNPEIQERGEDIRHPWTPFRVSNYDSESEAQLKQRIITVILFWKLLSASYKFSFIHSFCLECRSEAQKY